MKNRFIPFFLGVLLGAAIMYGVLSYVYETGHFKTHAAISDRPETWAEPIPRPNLPNLHRVSDEYYRGAQPKPAGFAELKAMGIRTVINLRLLVSDREETEQVGMNYVHIPAEAWDVDEDEIIRFLKTVTDENNSPVFVHCNHGADRTGFMTAIYRIVVQGWSRGEAIREMTLGGFGYHPIWEELLEYLRVVDVDRLRRKAGLDTE